MHLSGIFIYPIKAMGGISLDSVTIEDRGLRLDRRWMLIDENNRFICQRQIPQLALFQLEIREDSLLVHWQEESTIIPFDESQYVATAKVSIWNDELEALIAGEALNNWFSTRIGIPCKLAYQGKNSIRTTPPKYAPPSEVSLADGYPFLLVSEESLNFLNQKLEQPIKMDRFRPNLILSGGHPHVEDDFHFFKIGESNFTGVKPCARCNVITINQTTIEKGKEPLKTLTTYRSKNNKILFGQCLNYLDKDSGVLKIGDTIVGLDEKIQDD